MLLHPWNLKPSESHLLAAQKQNLYGRKFKNDSELETGVTRWLITK
jgi:hypothetical protein